MRHLNRLIRQAQGRNVGVIVDIPGHLFQSAHLKDLIFIKPNLTELEDYVGRKLSSPISIIKAARELAQDVRLVCVSSVNDGALLVSRKSACVGVPHASDGKQPWRR